MERKRIPYLDTMRVISLFAVIVLHTAASKWHVYEPTGAEWQLINLLDGAVRWCVPVFVMISGALFLPRELDLKTIFRRYVLRMFVVFFVWAFAYALYDVFLNPFSEEQPLIGSIVRLTFAGHYHMWFLPMIAGLYMMIPILRAITADRRLTRYFLIISFIFACLIPSLMTCASVFGGARVRKLASWAYTVVGYMHMQFFLGMTFYFIMGHALNTFEMTKKQRRIIYLLGIFGLAVTVLPGAYIAHSRGELNYDFFENLSANTALVSIAVFTLFKYGFRSVKVSARLSKLSFGAFLVHPAVLDALRILGADRLSAWLFVPLTAAATILASLALSFLLNLIPKNRLV